LKEYFQKTLPLFNSINMYSRYNQPKASKEMILFHCLKTDFELIQASPMVDQSDEETLISHRLRNV